MEVVSEPAGLTAATRIVGESWVTAEADRRRRGEGAWERRRAERGSMAAAGGWSRGEGERREKEVVGGRRERVPAGTSPLFSLAGSHWLRVYIARCEGERSISPGPRRGEQRAALATIPEATCSPGAAGWAPTVTASRARARHLALRRQQAILLPFQGDPGL